MNVASRITMLAGMAALAALACPRAKAQAEVAPDHFDSPNMVAFDQPKAGTVKAENINYAGEVTLAHRVTCNGKELAPGKYDVALHSDGKTVQMTLKRRGHNVMTQTAAYSRVQRSEQAYLVVERSGDARRLSAIHAGSVRLAFASGTASNRSSAEAGLEVFPLVLTAALS